MHVVVRPAPLRCAINAAATALDALSCGTETSHLPRPSLPIKRNIMSTDRPRSFLEVAAAYGALPHARLDMFMGTPSCLTTRRTSSTRVTPPIS